MPANALPPPSRVLIVRLSALGDLVFASTLAHGLQQRYPGALVDWLVQPEFSSFLQTQTGLHQVITWDRKRWGQLFKGWHWLSLLQEILAFRRQLRSNHYQLVLDAQGLAKSRALAWLAGGQRRVGYASKEPLGFLMHQQIAKPQHAAPYLDKRIASEHLALLNALAPLPHSPLLGPQLNRPSGVPAYSAGIVLAPFTTRPQKHWPEAHWATLIAQLATLGQPLHLLGGPADAAAASRILAPLPATVLAQVHNWVGKTLIPDAAACIADATAVIGVDTGLTHMGIAYGKPTVAIFGSTVPYRVGGTAPLAVLWDALPCSPCRRKPTCGGAFTCLSGISPARVMAALTELKPQ